MNKLIKTKENKRDIFLIVLHILLGAVATFFPLIISLIIIVAGLNYLFKYSRSDANKLHTLILISYLTALETLYRAAGVFFLPYELSKYVQIGLILFNLIITRTRIKSFVGILLLILLLPSSILFPANEYKNIVFTSFGIIATGFFISFTGNQKITFTDFVKILKSFLLPCISFVTFITIKTPQFSDIKFTLGANSETTGGFGSNQVATLLGAAICLIIIMVDKKKYIGNRLLTFGLMIYFFLRAFLSFSRGGIIGLIFSVVLSFVLFKKIKQSVIIKLAIMVILFSAVFIITNDLTGGELLLRYQGETAGTIAGTRVKNFETLSSGRTDYAQVDLEMWFDHVVFGVGPGNSQLMRYRYGMFDEGAPHTEATRLLAENGIFGLLINLILIFWPVHIIYKTRNREIKFIKTMLFAFGYATTFHSAMRTGLTPLFYGLASMNITPVNLMKRVTVPKLKSLKLDIPT